MRCGASGRRRRGTRSSQGCVDAVAPGARRRRRSRRRRTATGLTLLADDVDAQRFERLVGRGRELLTLGRAGAGGVRARRGLGAVARPAAGRCRELGAGADRGDPARGAAARRRGGPRRRRACRADSTARCWPRPRRWSPQAPLRERRWALLAAGPVPGRPAGRGAAHAAPGAQLCWRPSWASIRARSWSPWSRRSCARIRRWSPRRPRAGSQRDVPVPWARCRSTSATPTASSAVTSRSTSACVG